MTSPFAKPAALEAMPSPEVFAKNYARGEPQVVWTRLIADLETPVSAYMKLTHGSGQAQSMSFLLESVEGGATRGRYSVIGLDPDLVWRAHGDKAEINRQPRSKSGSKLGAFKKETAPALTSLRAVLAASRLSLPPGLPPMAAGVFGYMLYQERQKTTGIEINVGKSGISIEKK